MSVKPSSSLSGAEVNLILDTTNGIKFFGLIYFRATYIAESVAHIPTIGEINNLLIAYNLKIKA